MTEQYNYSQPHYLVIGPDMSKVDPPDPSDVEQCKEAVKEIARFNQERTGWLEAPDLRIFQVFPGFFLEPRDVTEIWIRALFPELAEQRTHEDAQAHAVSAAHHGG